MRAPVAAPAPDTRSAVPLQKPPLLGAVAPRHGPVFLFEHGLPPTQAASLAQHRILDSDQFRIDAPAVLDFAC